MDSVRKETNFKVLTPPQNQPWNKRFSQQLGVVTYLGPVFRKSRNLFGRISGDIILYVSSKLRRLEARNFAVIFIFNPFTTYEKTSITE